MREEGGWRERETERDRETEMDREGQKGMKEREDEGGMGLSKRDNRETHRVRELHVWNLITTYCCANGITLIVLSNVN